MPKRLTILWLSAALATTAPAFARNLGTVVFQPSPAQMLQAVSGQAPLIDPLPSSDRIRLSVPPFIGNIMASAAPVPAGVELVASCAPTSAGTSSEVVLTGRPTALCALGGWRGRAVDVTFQLRLMGSVAAGTHNISVTYDYVSSSNHGGRWSRSDTTTVTLTVPAIVGLQVNGGNTVAFDYASDPSGYVAGWGGTLPPTPTGTTLQSIGAYGNSGYVVTATAQPMLTNPTGAPSVSHLLVKGKRLSTSPVSIASAATPTKGLVTVVTAADYALAVDGSETPGRFDYTVDYSIVAP